jgi:hypothetical protein
LGLTTIEQEIISVLLLGLIFALIYVLGGKGPLFKQPDESSGRSPYTAGIEFGDRQITQVSDMVVFLFILLAVESLIIALFFVNITPWTILLYSVVLISTVLGYNVYMEENPLGRE